MTKKYNLKPGLHQFAPGSAAIHRNETLTDEEAEWYLQHYPHIAGLFEPLNMSEQPVKQQPIVTMANPADEITPPVTDNGSQTLDDPDQ